MDLEKGTFISNGLESRSEEYYLGTNGWSTNPEDWELRIGAGGIVNDPQGEWDYSTAEAYINEQITLEANIRQAQDTRIEGLIPLADNEDLANDSGYLKFKDRIYNQVSPNGMGMVILRNNIVNGVNTLTQSMINQANTIYIIQYDFALGEDITVPAGCVLEFDGGSISGVHTLTGTNTDIKAGFVKILSTDITLAGNWSISEAYPEWFGAKGDGITDDSNAIISALNLAMHIYPPFFDGYWTKGDGGGILKFGAKTYLYNVDNGINLAGKIGITFRGSSIGTTRIVSKNQFAYTNYLTSGIDNPRLNTIFNLSFEDITFECINAFSGAILDLVAPYNVRVKGCRFKAYNSHTNRTTVGLCLRETVETFVEACIFTDLNSGILLTDATTDIVGSVINQNTAFYIDKCWFFEMNSGVLCNFTAGGFIQNCNVTNCAFEQIGGNALSFYIPATNNPSQLIVKDCHFEQNYNAVYTYNCALVFDESNLLMLPGSDQNTQNMVVIGDTTRGRGGNNVWPIRNYISVPSVFCIGYVTNYKDRNYCFRIPSVLITPNYKFDSYNKEVCQINQQADDAVDYSMLSNLILGPNSGIVEIYGKGAYWKGSFITSASAVTNMTEITASPNVSIRNDNALVITGTYRMIVHYDTNYFIDSVS